MALRKLALMHQQFGRCDGHICGECVNCLIDNTERKYHLCMRHNSVFPRKVDLMDFCSYGERKEGADNG